MNHATQGNVAESPHPVDFDGETWTVDLMDAHARDESLEEFNVKLFLVGFGLEPWAHNCCVL